MKNSFTISLIAAGAFSTWAGASFARHPGHVHGVSQAASIAASLYAGEQGREIKSLSSDEVAGLKAGAGMAYAKAAGLNGYPGPAHVH